MNAMGPVQTHCIHISMNFGKMKLISLVSTLKEYLVFIVGKNGSGSGGASSSADAGINRGRPQSGKGAGSSYTCPKVKV